MTSEATADILEGLIAQIKLRNLTIQDNSLDDKCVESLLKLLTRKVPD